MTPADVHTDERLIPADWSHHSHRKHNQHEHNESANEHSESASSIKRRHKPS